MSVDGDASDGWSVVCCEGLVSSHGRDMTQVLVTTAPNCRRRQPTKKDETFTYELLSLPSWSPRQHHQRCVNPCVVHLGIGMVDVIVRFTE